MENTADTTENHENHDIEAVNDGESSQSNRTHVTALPKGFITVRIMQLLFAIIILGLAAADFAGSQTELESFIGMITAIVMTIIYAWIMLTYWVPAVYNYWAILAFEILGFFLWLDGFIWLLAASFDSYYDDYDYDCQEVYDVSIERYTYECNNDNSSNWATLNNAAIAAAAFGACELALSFVSLVVVSVFIARHRAADGHNRPGSAPPVAIVSKAGLRRENEELRRNQLEMQQRMLALQQQNAGNRLSGSAPEVQVNGANDNVRYA